MGVEVQHPVVVAYLAQLDAVAVSAGLSAARRAELRAEIFSHVDDALTEAPGQADDLRVAEVLDRLGPVEEIVAAEPGAVPRPSPMGMPDATAGPGAIPGAPAGEPVLRPPGGRTPVLVAVLFLVGALAVIVLAVGVFLLRADGGPVPVPVPVSAPVSPPSHRPTTHGPAAGLSESPTDLQSPTSELRSTSELTGT
jgi:hypothetical protein